MAKFRARARALDMLGRQQIAGVPSAINELFKNAYDAYATHVEGHFIREDDLLVIRDNGIGMTREDFEEKWLVLGTESKFGLQDDHNAIFRPPGMKSRPIAGEKGIGRLAIGILGPQVFVWTKAIRESGESSPIIAFVNWSAFGVPGINLEDLEVPLVQLTENEYPDTDILQKLVNDFRKSFISACTDRATMGRGEDVLRELDIPVDRIADWIEQLRTDRFDETQHGTMFLIKPAAQEFEDALVSSKLSAGDSQLVKELAGFSNTMVSDDQPLVIDASLWDHRGLGDSSDVLGEADFWDATDFAECDHEIKGDIDEFGNFSGQIRIFRSEFVNHLIPNKESHGHKTECGPFQIRFGIVQGVQRESSLDPQKFAEMQSRLGRFAGVYVYRDGLRVLPYGKSDNDWLGIEERRTKSATYYFFSHRRMFGYVSVTRRRNSELREKAGREGFQENRAYKQLKGILEQLLTQLAADHFRGDKDDPTVFRLGLKENLKVNNARERFEKSKKEKIRKFRASLHVAESLLEGSEIEDLTADIVGKARMRVAALSDSLSPGETVQQLVEIESEAYRSLNEITQMVSFSRPRGIAVGKSLDRAYEIVVDRRARIESEILTPAKQEVHDILDRAAREAGTSINARLRVSTLVEQSTAGSLRDARRQVSTARLAAQELSQKINALTESTLADLDQELRKILLQTQEFDYDGGGEVGAEAFLASTLHEVRLTTEFFSGALTSLSDLLSSLEFDWDREIGLITSLDESQALDQEIEDLREQADYELELAQLGLSVDIINHEFLGSLNAIRKALKSLDSWVEVNPDMKLMGGILNTNFTHLENFLELFTPLRKRFNAEKTTIRGTEIVDYLQSIFYEKFKTEEIELIVSQSFRDRKVKSYASIILPVFTNLVDNAVFWLKDQPSPRQIELSVDSDDWFVSDTGPGIPERYRTSIFSAGFTTKPGGRGLGLYIAKQVLGREGFDIEVCSAPRLGRGTTFRIGPKRTGEDVDDGAEQ